MTSKLRKRLAVILAHSVSRVIVPLMSIAVSLMVTRLASIELWGEFVPILIFINLATQIMSWGSGGHLLREFSRSPGNVARIWQSSLASRLPLLGLCVLAGIFIELPFEHKALLLFWTSAAFVYSAYDVVIVYKKRFRLTTVLETIGFVLIVALLLFSTDRLNLITLIGAFAIATVFKALAASLYFRRDLFTRRLARFDFSFLRRGFAFFIPGFSGLLQSRMDLYCVTYFLPARQAGQYQILMSLLLYAQSIATFVVTPYVKSFYRLPTTSIQKINALIGRIGIVLSVLSIVGIYFLISHYYQLQFSAGIYLIGYLFVLPFYFYFVRTYQLIKADRQAVVAMASFAGGLLNFVLSIVLIPRLEIAGALLAGAAVQWALLLFYLSYDAAAYAPRAARLAYPAVSSIQTSVDSHTI